MPRSDANALNHGAYHYVYAKATDEEYQAIRDEVARMPGRVSMANFVRRCINLYLNDTYDGRPPFQLEEMRPGFKPQFVAPSEPIGACFKGVHAWTDANGSEAWIPAYGVPCDCGGKRWGMTELRRAQP